MSYTITKEFSFSAAHQLVGLPTMHPCSRLHGHNYIVRVVIGAEELDLYDFVIDYNKLDWFRRLIDLEYDHRNLNDVVSFNPTAENLAKHLTGKVTNWLDKEYHDKEFAVAVAVSETPKTWAWYAQYNGIDT